MNRKKQLLGIVILFALCPSIATAQSFMHEPSSQREHIINYPALMETLGLQTTPVWVHAVCQQAVMQGDQSTLNTLLKKYPRILSGDTAILTAARANQWQLLSFLLEHGANPNAKDENDKSVLMYLASTDELNGENRMELINTLCNYHVHLNAQDKQGKTALMYAVETDHIEMLVPVKQNVEIQDNEGKTALMYAAEYNRLNWVEMLVFNGANIHTQDHSGMTALNWAFYWHHIKFYQALETSWQTLHPKDDAKRQHG